VIKPVLAGVSRPESPNPDPMAPWIGARLPFAMSSFALSRPSASPP